MSSNIINACKILKNFTKYKYQEFFNINTYPRSLVFYTTFVCDSRCKACNIWKNNAEIQKKTELTLTEIENIFSNELFKKLTNINIQGGEATTREDIVEIVAILSEKLPNLKNITLTSNGLNTENVSNKIHDMYSVCHRKGVGFTAGFSIDGTGKYHDYARGKNAFKRVCNTIEKVKSLNKHKDFSMATTCVLSANNIYNLYEITKFQLRVFNKNKFHPVEARDHFLNDGLNEELLFEHNLKEKEMFLTFLRSNSVPKHLTDFESYRYDQLKMMYEGESPRTQSCKYMTEGLVLDHLGKLQICPIGGRIGSCRKSDPQKMYFSNETKKIKKELRKKKCPQCFPYSFNGTEIEKDILKYLFFYTKKKIFFLND